MLKHNKTGGTIVVNQTLVLQNLRENQAGSYKCVGENSEGSADSNVLELKIKCTYKIDVLAYKLIAENVIFFNYFEYSRVR